MTDQTDDAVVRYGVKELLALQGETLKRIESKVDTNALAQAEAIGRLDTRVSLLEAKPDLEPRVMSLEETRSEHVGARDYGRWLWPALIALGLLIATVITIHFHH